MVNRVYKSGGKDYEYLITLDVNPDDTNLKRKGVVNKDTAKFRCKKAFVADIQHKETGKLVDSIQSNYNSKFIYKRGEYIEEPAYDDDIDKVCSKGIHFFTTKEPALLFNYIPKKYNGVYKSWNENGQLMAEYKYKNGILEGPYKQWHENGQLFKEHEYKNWRIEGPYKEWYENGQLKVAYKYKNGKLEGLCKEWHEMDNYLKNMNIKMGN